MRCTIAFWLEAIISGLFLWLGLFVISRDLPSREERSDWWRRPGLWGGLAMVLASWFFLGVALRTGPDLGKEEYLFWLRVTGWVVPLGVASWLQAVILIVSDGKKSLPSLVLAYAVLIAIGDASVNFMRDPSKLVPRSSCLQPFSAPSETIAYVLLYSLPMGVGLWVGVALLGRHLLHSQKSTKHRKPSFGLTIGSGVFALGVTLNIVDNALFGRSFYLEYVSHLIVALGLISIGIAIAHYNALVHRRVIREDFWRSFIGTFAVVWLFLLVSGVLSTLPRYDFSPESVILLIHLPILTLTSSEWATAILDGVILPTWKAEYRLKLRQAGREILATRDPVEKLEIDEAELPRIAQKARARAKLPSEKQVVQAVRNILQRKPIYAIDQDDLVETVFLELKMVQEIAEGFRKLGREKETWIKAQAVRDFLETFISEGFQPPGEETNPLTPEWIDYYLLYLRYVRGWELEDVKVYLEDRVRNPPGSERTWSEWYLKAKTRLGKYIYRKERDLLLKDE